MNTSKSSALPSGVNVIGFSGKMGSGKNYLAEVILPEIIDMKAVKVMYLSFADTLKVLTSAKYSKPIEDMYGKKTKENRRLLQLEGTERGRNVHGADYWLNILFNWIQAYSKPPNHFSLFVITDCRFPNEAAWVSKHGILIRLVASDRNKVCVEREADGDAKAFKMITEHLSETALDDHRFEHVIDNSVANQSNVKQVLAKIVC